MPLLSGPPQQKELAPVQQPSRTESPPWRELFCPLKLCPAEAAQFFTPFAANDHEDKEPGTAPKRQMRCWTVSEAYYEDLFIVNMHSTFQSMKGCWISKVSHGREELGDISTGKLTISALLSFFFRAVI